MITNRMLAFALILGVSDAGGHDATRKMKNELLVQMEGCTTGDQHVMLIGATNVPQVPSPLAPSPSVVLCPTSPRALPPPGFLASVWNCPSLF